MVMSHKDFWLGFLKLLIFLIALTWFQTVIQKDSTDSKDERSQMSLFTDHGTGCQYLSRTFGGLTPRMGADGQQVCYEIATP